jgi:hypothetical protein
MAPMAHCRYFTGLLIPEIGMRYPQVTAEIKSMLMTSIWRNQCTRLIHGGVCCSDKLTSLEYKLSNIGSQEPIRPNISEFPPTGACNLRFQQPWFQRDYMPQCPKYRISAAVTFWFVCWSFSLLSTHFFSSVGYLHSLGLVMSVIFGTPHLLHHDHTTEPTRCHTWQISATIRAY